MLSTEVATPTVAVAITSASLSVNGPVNAATIRSANTSTASAVRRVVDEQRELVAAEPRGGVGRAHRRRQPPGHRRQQLVAGAVAHRVVHDLEVVQVDEEHADGPLGRAGAWSSASAARSANSTRFGRPVSASW